VQDAEVDFYLTLATADNVVAYLLCVAICGVLARQISSGVGPVQEQAQQKFDHYQQLAAMFYSLSQGGGPLPGTGGIGSAAPLLAAGDLDPHAFFVRRPSSGRRFPW
jgi:hypothetical protein